MREYYEILGMMHSMSKMQWLRIALSVSEDMDTYLVWSKVHPKLPGFLKRAMQIYSEKLTN